MSSATNDSAIWQLDGTTARLRVSHLQALVDLHRPAQGLSNLKWNGKHFDGSLLGIAAGQQPLEAAGLVDAFARGDDLVVTYGKIDQGPFSLQVYWTVATDDRGAILVDALLSLQTPLLESFPEISTKSQLPGGEAWRVPLEGPPTQVSRASAGQWHEQPDAILLRISSGEWSYVETTHPDDRGRWQVEFPSVSRCVVRRELGGAFLEKGVIRRMRVRGALLPSEHDLNLAAQCRAEFSILAPPLTV